MSSFPTSRTAAKRLLVLSLSQPRNLSQPRKARKGRELMRAMPTVLRARTVVDVVVVELVDVDVVMVELVDVVVVVELVDVVARLFQSESS